MSQTMYGHFDDAAREYVITNPATPYPWINYLGSKDFFSLISNTAGGYAFYRDAKYRRITRYRYNSVPIDDGGRYFYIYDAGKVWSPSWKPCKTPLDSYECRHGMNYTRITGKKDGLRASVLFFVPLDAQAEVQKVTLTNESSETKRVKLFSCIEWCMWNAASDMENFQRNLSIGEVEIDGSVLYHKTEYKERRNHYAFYSANAPIAGFDTDRDSFIGMYNGFDAPQCVMSGEPSNSVAQGWNPIASHCIDIELAPNESRDIIFLLGYVEQEEVQEKFSAEDIERKQRGELLSSQEKDITLVNKAKARCMIERFATVEAVDKAFEELRALWDKLLGKFTLKSADERLNRMVNIWNQYQCMITFNFSRSASFFESGIGRGMGFRDSNQDLVGFVHLLPTRARERIIDIAKTQRSDGSCYHQYQPLTKRGNNDIGSGFNDDPLWLIFAAVAYIKETGDFSILDEHIGWDDEPDSTATLLHHLRASFDYTLSHRGPHGLPLIGRADWNDCLNLNCFSTDPNESFQTTENNAHGSQAESLMIAGLFVFVGREYAELCSVLGAKEEQERATQAVEEMSAAVEKDGWDGEWFLRAYDYYGNKVGSHTNKEGQLFIESQGFCAMAGIGRERGLTTTALDAVKKYLDTPHGIALLYPPFSSYDLSLGEISSYPAGYKENAGIFCHNNPWVIIAETMEHRAKDAWEHYTKICPAWLTDQALHKTEPYVYAQMIAGPHATKHGEAKNSWLTGTATWNWLAISQYILGIRPEYEGLKLDPCLPPELNEYTVVRRFRQALYTIHILKTKDSSPSRVTLSLDGEAVEGNVLPYSPGEHYAEVRIE